MKRQAVARLATAILVVGATSMVTGYATFAFFSDTGLASDNVFQAGTIDMKTGDQDSTSGTIGASNFAPGDVASGQVELTNDGTIHTDDPEAHSLDVDLVFTVVAENASGSGGSNMDAFLNVTELTYTNPDGSIVDLASLTTDQNSNGFIDLEDVHQHDTYTDLAAPGAQSTQLNLTVKFDTSAGNNLQGDTVDVSVDFLLSQAGAEDLSRPSGPP